MSYEQLGRVLVVVPTYNEIQNLPIVTQGIRAQAPTVDILIADDGSPDGTGALADTFAATDSHIRVLHRTQKAGLGAAYLAAFEWARAEGYDVVVEMDADGSHRPVDLPLLLNALVDADVVLGSRWVKGGRVVNWPKSREALSRGGNLYTKLWLGMPVGDATGGFRAYRMTALAEMDLTSVQSQGYCFQVDMAWRAVRSGLRVREVPITFVERELGESKMDGAIVQEALKRVTAWGWTKRTQDLKDVVSRQTK